MSELESRGVKRPAEMDSDGEQLESPQKQQRLLEDLASEASRASLEMFKDGKHSDVTVRCQGHEWKLHRCILVPRSEFFRACCAGNFKESDNNEINMDDDNPGALHCYLEYLYTYSDPLFSDQENGIACNTPKSGMLWHELLLRTFQIADKYDAGLLLHIMKQKALSFIRWNEPDADELAACVDLLWSMGEVSNILALRDHFLAKLAEWGFLDLKSCDRGKKLPDGVENILKGNPQMACALVSKSWELFEAEQEKTGKAESALQTEVKRREEAERALQAGVEKREKAEHAVAALRKEIKEMAARNARRPHTNVHAPNFGRDLVSVGWGSGDSYSN